MDTLIIGGGAAGICAAIALARRGREAWVIDRNRRPLKKLGVSGNGRGNLLNSGDPCYFGDEAFARAVLAHQPYGEVRAFLESCGITLTQEEEGRIYPAAYQAGVAVDGLLGEARRLGIRVESNTRITDLRRGEKGFTATGERLLYAPDTLRKSGKIKPGEPIGTEPVTFHAHRVIVAAGGAAAPKLGTDGTAYHLLTVFGHRLVEPKPALCALRTEKAPIAPLEGQRAKARLWLTDEYNSPIRESEGEILWTEDGVSGIAAMQLARDAKPGMLLHIDLTRALFGMDAGVETLARRAQSLPSLRLEEFWAGAAPQSLSQALLKKAGLWDRRLQRVETALEDDGLFALWRALSDFTLEIEGTRDFDAAQTTAGGIDCADFEPATMESRLCPGLYAAGEVLNVDGACGGFNLMFAFAGGLLAGGAAACSCER